MFDLVKQQVSLLQELEKDLGVEFRPIGEKNWRIDGDKDVEGCPFCSHHDCFRIKHEEGDNGSSFYKCFSCGKHGDVITWRSERKKIDLKTAAKELAHEAGIRLPNDYNPVQQVFSLAAEYYHNCLVDTCDKPYPVLNGLTPLRYQMEIRHHKKDTLEKFKIGYSDGGLISYLTSVGIDEEILKQSGLVSKKGGDFLPSNCFIYPHFVRGRVSHFTFKDPLKRIQYQLPKKYSLNGYLFYGQDLFLKDATLFLVEGENDWLSLMESGSCSAAMAIIGQLSAEQLEWIKNNGKTKRIMTVFDPDDAGDGYRQKLESIRRYLGGLIHVRPPDDKDIDEHLSAGAALGDLVRANVVEVVLEQKKAAQVVEDALWTDVASKAPLNPLEGDSQTPASGDTGLSPGMHVSGPVPTVVNLEERLPATFDSDMVVAEEGCIVQKRGRYYKIKTNKDGIPEETRLSDFTIELLNVYEDETGERHREIILVKHDGYRSKPFIVNSEVKVTVKLFKILVAKFADCEWLGREAELDGVWRLVYNKFPDVTIAIAGQVGRYEKENCWIFKNILITGSGVVVEPDSNGVFWPNGRSRGIKADSISTTEGYDCIPALSVGMTRDEAKVLLGQALQGFTRILNNPGPALMAVGWIYSNVYSNEIFKYNGGMGSLMFWGVAGKGKSTIVKWLQKFFGFTDKMASTSVQQLRSAIGFLRKAEYYASLPMFLDELRADELSSSYLGMIRSWYDREGRTIADINNPKKIRNQKINATLIIGGEDLPEDPATKERCIMIRVPQRDLTDPILQKNYDDMERLSESFGNITYFWILDSCMADKPALLKEIRKLDSTMVEHGCSNRLSKVWAGAAFFAKKLAEEYYPDYDFMKYLVETSSIENTAQKNDNTLARFFEALENLQATPNSPITDDHIGRDSRDTKLINIWYSAVFKEVCDGIRDQRQKFSKQAILRAIREEPYFVSDDRKVNMGVKQVRRTVLTLDLTKAPDPVRNLVEFEK